MRKAVVDVTENRMDSTHSRVLFYLVEFSKRGVGEREKLVELIFSFAT